MNGRKRVFLPSKAFLPVDRVIGFRPLGQVFLLIQEEANALIRLLRRSPQGSGDFGHFQPTFGRREFGKKKSYVCALSYEN